MGYLYQPKLKSGGTGSIYWCKYYVNGRAVRESTGCEKEKEGRAFLKRREGAVANGAPIMPRADRITYDELAADLRRHYTTTGARDLREAGKRLRHLDRFFTGARAVTITPARITEYVETRQKATRRPDGTEKPGAANGSINRELSVLGAMLRRGYKNNKVLRLPMIEKLEEAAPRAGFFEDHQYEAVRQRLPEDLQAATALMYTYGWRVGEVLSREWRHVDL